MTELKEGDEVIFYGNLFSDKNRSKLLSKSVIKYKIASILKNGMIITAHLSFKFSDGEIEFMDRIFVGSIVTDPDGNITSVEFYDFKDNTDLMVFLEGMEPELMYFLNDVVEKLNQ